MASSSPTRHAWRVLLSLLVVTGVLFGINALGVYVFGKSSWTPELALDLQGAGTPDTYSLEAFRLAFLMQVPLWVLGVVFIIIERKRTRIRIGLDPERGSRRSRRS